MFDASPVEVRGALRASRARVIWSEGKLYIVRNIKDIRVYDTDEPVRTANTVGGRQEWTAGQFTFFRRGCSSCGYTLGRYSAQTLIDKAAQKV